MTSARSSARALPACLALLLSSACGPAQTEEPTTPPTPTRQSGEVDDGMVVEGITGSLPRDEVDPVMNRAAGDFQECYAQAYQQHPYLAGDLAFHVVVGVDGSVTSVQTTASTLGSREVEECILAITRSLTFPRPNGGREAMFDYGPLVMGPDDGQDFVLWSEADITEQAEAVAQLWSSCTGGEEGYQVSFYVGPGGQVTSVGAVAPSAEGGEAARCLERELQNLTFADPGQIAKLTLEM